MNCAVVTIGGGTGGSGSGGIDLGDADTPLIDGDQGIGKRSSPSSMLQKRSWGGPGIFLANIGNGCSTPPGKDLDFPNPGSDVEYLGNAATLGPPQGSNCGSGSGGYGGTGNGSASGRGKSVESLKLLVLLSSVIAVVFGLSGCSGDVGALI